MWLVRIFRRLLGTLLLHKPHVHICCQQDKSVTGLPEGLPGSGCALPFIELELPCPADFLHSDAGGWKYLVALYIKNNFNRWNRKGYNTVACWLMCVFPALSFFFLSLFVYHLHVADSQRFIIRETGSFGKQPGKYWGFTPAQGSAGFCYSEVWSINQILLLKYSWTSELTWRTININFHT